MTIPLGEVVSFDETLQNPTTGAASDGDSAPTFEVFEESTDTAIVTGTMTKRTSKTGNYRGTFTASTGNGFEAGKWYSVVTSATVSSVTGKRTSLLFRALAAENVAGVPAVDVVDVNGLAATPQEDVATQTSLDTVSDNVVTTRDNTAQLISDVGGVSNDVAGVSSQVDSVQSDTTALVTRITATLFSGVTSLAQWLGLIAGKQVGNSTARTELRDTGAGSGTFNETTDSLEAVRDRGDAAWTMGAGVGGGGGGAGTGDTPVTAATLDDDGDDMLVKTSGGSGIDDVDIRAYVASEWDADPITATIRGETRSLSDGTWEDVLMLDTGITYTIVMSKSGYVVGTTEVTP